MNAQTKEALERLLAVAARDTGQSRRVADILLSWWNAESCGGIGPTQLWGLDDNLRTDCVRVFAYAAMNRVYPDELGYEPQFLAIIKAWRPKLKV